MKRYYLLIMLFIMASCSQTSELRFNERFQKDYPEARYMSAMGMGTDLEMATANAYAGLARQFNSKVHVNESVLKRYNAFTDMNGYEETISEESVSNIQIKANQDIVNVSLTAPQHGPRDMVYILAYIPRAATAEILSGRINRNREMISAYAALAESADHDVQKYIYYNAAWLISAKNEMMFRQIEVLDNLRLPKNFHYNYARLTTLKEFYSNSIEFTVSIRHDEDGKLWHSVSEAITEAGFAVTRQAGDMYVVGDVYLSPKEMHQKNLSFMTWNLNLKMNDFKGNAVFAITHTGTEGSLDKSGATQKAYQQMSTFTKDQFTNELIEYFDNYLIIHGS